MEFGNFAGGLMKGFNRARERAERQKDEKTERDSKVKLFELQLKRAQREEQQSNLQQLQIEQQQSAQKELFAKMQPPLLKAPLLDAGQPDQNAKMPSLTQLLADPQNAMLLLKSGMMKPDDLVAQENNTANRAMMEKFMSGGNPQGMEMTGVKIGPNGQMMPDFGLPQVTTQTVDTPDGPEIGTYNSRTGQKVATIGAPKKDTVAPETAGRISGLVQAQQIAQQIRGQFITPGGKIDRTLVMTSFANAPGTKGREIRNDIGIAVDAVLRARTGAGVNVTEQKQVVEQFLPSPLDDDATITSKLGRLDQFINGTLDIATLPPSLRQRLEKADQRQQLPSGIPHGSRQIGTSNGKPVFQTPEGKQLIVE